LKLKTEQRRHNGFPLDQEESTNMEMRNQKAGRNTKYGNSVGFFLISVNPTKED